MGRLTASKRLRLRKLYAKAARLHPAVFSGRYVRQPLAIGIDERMVAAGWSKKEARELLRFVVTSIPYLIGMLTSVNRVNLEGVPVAPIEVEHRRRALHTLLLCVKNRTIPFVGLAASLGMKTSQLRRYAIKLGLESDLSTLPSVHRAEGFKNAIAANQVSAVAAGESLR